MNLPVLSRMVARNEDLLDSAEPGLIIGNCLYGDFEVKGEFRGPQFLFCMDAFDALGLAVWIGGLDRSGRRHGDGGGGGFGGSGGLFTPLQVSPN